MQKDPDLNQRCQACLYDLVGTHRSEVAPQQKAERDHKEASSQSQIKLYHMPVFTCTGVPCIPVQAITPISIDSGCMYTAALSQYNSRVGKGLMVLAKRTKMAFKNTPNLQKC